MNAGEADCYSRRSWFESHLANLRWLLAEVSLGVLSVLEELENTCRIIDDFVEEKTTGQEWQRIIDSRYNRGIVVHNRKLLGA